MAPRPPTGESTLPEPAPAPAVELPSWAVGETGVFIGLSRRADLNGQRARVAAIDRATGRIVAETASESVKVRPENLARPPPSSCLQEELVAPSELWRRARAAKGRGQHVDALRLAFEAAQIDATYGTQDPRLCLRPEDEAACEAAAMDWLLDGSAGSAEALLPLLDEVNRKLQLDPDSARARMNSTDVGRQNWASIKEHAPLMHAMMANPDLGEEELRRLLEEEDLRLEEQEDEEDEEDLRSLLGGSASAFARPSQPRARAAQRVVQPAAPSDPRQFASLPHFAPAQQRVWLSNGESSALMWAFSCSIPPIARFSTMGGRSAKGTAPAVQWCYSAFHICHHYEQGVTCFQVEDDEETEALLLEVRGVRACPPDLGLEREHYTTPLEQRPLGPAPLLLVRYVHHTKVGLNEAALEVAQKFFDRAGRTAAGMIVKVRAASSAEVHYAKAMLDVHRQPSASGFADSALYPPRRADVEHSLAQLGEPGKQLLSVCALCGATASLRCGHCKMAMYCCAEHQKRHWKESHKALCGGSATTARNSVLFDPAANATANINANRGTVSSPVQPKNIHGDRDFVVKLQPPLEGGEFPWMCYDERRSFQCYVPADTQGLASARGLLETTGIRATTFDGRAGLKGFFSARWEGARVRIFVDALLPDPGW